jgi:seryl-tRNA synthetase
MHDIRLIRENPEAFDRGLARRGLDPLAKALIALDEERRALTTRVQVAQSRRNEASKLIGAAMAKGDKDGSEALKAEVAALKDEMPALEARADEVAGKLKAMLEIIPNLPGEDVPDGGGEEDNRVEKEWGEKRAFDFEPKEHADIAPALGMDFETGARLSGARFTFLRGGMARLHRALGQFMLDVQTGEHGYSECNPPLLVKDSAMEGTGQLPKFKDDSFATYMNGDQAEKADVLVQSALPVDDIEESMRSDQGIGVSNLLSTFAAGFRARGYNLEDRRWLIPTSEVSLTNSVREQIIESLSQPIRLTALTQCFRSEAGSAGRDTRGFIRQHQFEKCELVSIVRPEDSEAEHERMTRAAETILRRLKLPYRKMLLCTGDMGFGARKTYDLEVWLPGQMAFREISSCSNMGDFQARRMNTRYRVAGEKRTEFVHTLNGSGLAVGRTLVAVIENYQNADGSVTVPEALRPYMGGLEVITPQ